MYQPAFGILSHYFQRRRAFVMGIATAGASLGGVVYPSKLGIPIIPETASRDNLLRYVRSNAESPLC